MFDILPNFLTALTILFAVYASHKAVSSPPSPQQSALLSPWLTYFLILALSHVVEGYVPIIPSLPLYAWARLFAHIYLLLPGNSQGAGFLYTAYLAPFIRQHEREIESFIADTNAVLRKAGLDHAEQLLEYVKVHLLGWPPSRRDPAAEAARAPPTTNSYVASLLGRFAAPTAAGSMANAQPGGLSSLLGAALAQASNMAAVAGSRDGAGGAGAGARAADRDALLPPHLSSDRERLAYIASQREHLRTLLGLFDREEQTIHLASAADAGAGGMGRSRSEAEFETIRSEDVGDGGDEGSTSGGSSGGSARGWGGWLVGRGKEAAARASGVDVAPAAKR